MRPQGSRAYRRGKSTASRSKGTDSLRGRCACSSETEPCLRPENQACTRSSRLDPLRHTRKPGAWPAKPLAWISYRRPAALEVLGTTSAKYRRPPPLEVSGTRSTSRIRRGRSLCSGFAASGWRRGAGSSSTERTGSLRHPFFRERKPPRGHCSFFFIVF